MTESTADLAATAPGITLTVVGCSGSFPGAESSASCYLVEYDGFRLVVDLGSGALGPLQRYVALDAVDAVLVTHLHPDHWLDLCPYFVARTYHPEGPRSAVAVYGPHATAAQLAAAYGGARDDARFAEVFSFRDVVAGRQTVGPFTITAARAAHPIECWAVRIEAGARVLVYTADTGPSSVVAELARGADLLLAEAAFVDGASNPPGLHLTGRQAGELARDAGVGRLVVTHVPPWNDPAVALAEASAVFDGACVLAAPGARYTV